MGAITACHFFRRFFEIEFLVNGDPWFDAGVDPEARGDRFPKRLRLPERVDRQGSCTLLGTGDQGEKQNGQYEKVS
ncbi:MAG: hypothetical protein AAF368_10680, partial [Planctomycetota bacterium]